MAPKKKRKRLEKEEEEGEKNEEEEKKEELEKGDPENEDDEEKEKARWTGTFERFSELMIPFVTSSNFLVYDEAKIVTKTRVLPDRILQAKAILGAFHDEHESLSFIRSVTKKGFGDIFDKKKKELKLSDKDRNEWIETMTNRWHNLCRSVNQGFDDVQ